MRLHTVESEKGKRERRESRKGTEEERGEKAEGKRGEREMETRWSSSGWRVLDARGCVKSDPLAWAQARVSQMVLLWRHASPST